ncbi:hypothetical protein M407DRAFT_173077 [Tulasnella calospora MUT 4182]|uniref:Uncharacterized protein n=1 Tax=Tulasnella calospora MUT 4182 TaxID=1051891 RepID=A0A0C3L5S6_9AGAM|nr:hypothetical protein M407DRAFT_173077 [Tulasnella calospora MUT 4182]
MRVYMEQFESRIPQAYRNRLFSQLLSIQLRLMDFLQALAFDEQSFRRQLRSCTLSELEGVEKLLREQVADISRDLATAGREPPFLEKVNLESRMALVKKKQEMVQQEWTNRGYHDHWSYLQNVGLPLLSGFLGGILKPT